MKKYLKLTFLILIVSLCACEEKKRSHFPPPGNDADQLYVVNSLDGTISLVDISEDTVFNLLFSTGFTPAEVQFQDSCLYLVNSGDNTLQVINVFTGEEEIIEIGDYRNPAFLELLDDNIVATTNMQSGTVSFINLTTDSVETEVPVGNGLWGMTYHNGKIYVGITNYNPIDYTYGQGRVAIIDANSRTLEDSIEVSTNPGIIFVDLQEEVNVVCTGDYFSVFGEVWRIDPQSGAVIGHFTLGGMPISERLSVEGKVFLAGGGDWATQGFLLEYDAQTETVLHGGDNPIVIPDKSSIMDVALDSQGRIYLASFSSDEILQLDPVSFAITNSYKVGDGPQKMVLVNI